MQTNNKKKNITKNENIDNILKYKNQTNIYIISKSNIKNKIATM